MEKIEMISILILDEDDVYAALLAQRLAAVASEFSVTANPPGTGEKDSVSDKASILDAALDGAGPYARCDFTIVSENVAAARANEADGADGTRLIILSKSPQAPEAAAGRKAGAGDARRRLYASRYGRVSGLAALIRAEHAARSERGGFPQKLASGAVKYVGCFGLGGRCGLSSIAIGIGRDFAAYKGRRVLYLSLESLEAERLCIRAAEGERHIGDFMYLMLRKRETDLRMFSEACLFRDSYGLARFFPSPGLNDLALASPEELGEFLRFFDCCGAFDLIVLDLGNECRGAVSELIRLCDVLVLAENGGIRDAGKRDRAEVFAREAWRRDGADPVFAENMRRFRCDSDDEEYGDAPEEDLAADGAERITIGYDDASFRYVDGTTDFVLSGEFGLGIRKLADILFARICE
jgi:hypothetical protein